LADAEAAEVVEMKLTLAPGLMDAWSWSESQREDELEGELEDEDGEGEVRLPGTQQGWREFGRWGRGLKGRGRRQSRYRIDAHALRAPEEVNLHPA
jgi:hypothetical protein